MRYSHSSVFTHPGSVEEPEARGPKFMLRRVGEVARVGTILGRRTGPTDRPSTATEPLARGPPDDAPRAHPHPKRKLLNVLSSPCPKRVTGGACTHSAAAREVAGAAARVALGALEWGWGARVSLRLSSSEQRVLFYHCKRVSRALGSMFRTRGRASRAGKAALRTGEGLGAHVVERHVASGAVFDQAE
eukprot:scaffold714_cov121-Isochrysis_galbana.AAC.6